MFARAVLVSLALAAGGCATTSAERDPRDPLEPLNRAVFRFNDAVDENIAKPVATAYRDVLPSAVRDRVRNFFGNIADLWTGANNVLQGKFYEGFEDGMRVVFNTTLGLFGIHDVASEMGIEKREEDFGQTLGRWGVGPGPYVVLPLLGPSTVRDTGGKVLDWEVDPVTDVRPINLRNSLVGVRAIQQRADLLDAGQLLEQAALDRYVFLRDAYLQRRRSEIYDGSPPREKLERPDYEEESPAETPKAEPTSSLAPGYFPRIPRNYDAVMAANHAPTR